MDQAQIVKQLLKLAVQAQALTQVQTQSQP